MAVLSIQSSVSYGRVGNRAAVFALERMGHEVWSVDTVRFSNHPAYGAHRGSVLGPRDVRTMLDGIAERGVLGACEAVLSGYLGDPLTADEVGHAVDGVKAANPEARYMLDPVMGEPRGGLYVRPGIPEAIRDHLLGRADIVVPNAFEAAMLAGIAWDETAPMDAARDAAAKLLDRGPSQVVVTGIGRGPEIASLAVSGQGAWRAACPRVEAPSHGAGDAFSAVLLARLLEGDGLGAALGHAVAALHAVIEATAGFGLDYLALVHAQAALSDPPRRFAVERLE